MLFLYLFIDLRATRPNNTQRIWKCESMMRQVGFGIIQMKYLKSMAVESSQRFSVVVNV